MCQRRDEKERKMEEEYDWTWRPLILGYGVWKALSYKVNSISHYHLSCGLIVQALAIGW